MKETPYLQKGVGSMNLWIGKEGTDNLRQVISIG